MQWNHPIFSYSGISQYDIHVNGSATIKISKKTKSRLEKQKNHPGETYDAVLVRILEYISQDDNLCPKTIKSIKKVLQTSKQAVFIPWNS